METTYTGHWLDNWTHIPSGNFYYFWPGNHISAHGSFPTVQWLNTILHSSILSWGDILTLYAWQEDTKSVVLVFSQPPPCSPVSPIQIPAPSPGLLCWDNEDPNARPLVRTVHCFHKTPIVVPWGLLLHFKAAFSLRAKIYDFTISCNLLPHTPQLFTRLSVGRCRHTVWCLAEGNS